MEMEPKDLKNSEELKSTEKTELKKTEQNIVSEEEKTVEETTTPKEEVSAEVEETIVEEAATPKEEVSAEVEETIVEETATPVEEVVAEVEETIVEETVTPKEEVSAKVEETTVEEEKVVAEETPEIVEVVEATPAKEEEVAEPVAEEAVALAKEEEKVEEEKPVAEKEETTEEPKKEEVKAEEKVVKVPKKTHRREQVDYTNHSQVELVNALRGVLGENENYNIKDEVETIKAVFYKNLNEKIVEAKKKFVEEGGKEEEFVSEGDPYENDIKDLLKDYRHLRIEFSKKLEHEKEDNLKLKYQVIEDIKGLINSEESINKTFHDFKELQRSWREIGLVPQAKMKNLWDTYHFHVENFYDYIKINRELRDLDLKKNLEAKIILCERAEELLVEASIIKAFNTLQKYHEQWREIGPVPREQKDDIWERFKAATQKINKKHQEFYEGRKTEQKKNLEAKTALCEKVEEIKIEEIANHREWDEKSKELVELQKMWRTIGFAPRKDNNKIYDRFRSSCDKFFDTKREFYSKNKEEQQNNLQLKTDLCVQAETLKDSTDWKKTTQDFINIQKKWKEIGAVPRKHSDNVWKRFRAACDLFFENKSKHFSGVDNEQVDNLKAKEALIEEVINFKSTGDVNENLNLLKDFQRRWTDTGHVPFKKKDEIQSEFRDAINKLYDELNIDDDKRNMLKFRSKMSSFSESSRGQNKMRFERDKYMSKMKQLESDLIVLDNNIGFFAKSKNAESLIQDVKNKIEVAKQKIEFLKNKIRVIDEMDKED